MLNKPKVDNYRKAWAVATKDYGRQAAKATWEDKMRAIACDESVAEAEQDYMLSLDFSHFYNAGDTYESFEGTDRDRYRQWVEDWGLEEPNGKPPKVPFNYQV